MPTIYKRNCEYCGRYYEGFGRRFCSYACRADGMRRKPQNGSSPAPTPAPAEEPPKTDEFWTYLDKNRKEEVNWRELFNLAENHQSINLKLSSAQEVARVKVHTDRRYFAVVFTADWHGGSVATDYKMLRHYLDLILQNDLHIITLGDLNDNFRKFKSLEAIFSQALNPAQQMELLASIVKEFAARRKWLAACWGNHDVSWDEKNFGQSPVKTLLGKHFVYFNGKGLLKLKVNDQEYNIGMSHVFRGHSMYNPTHALIRAIKQDFGAANVDVVAQGDKHNYSYQWFNPFGELFGGRPCHFIQVGTFKTEDGYSKRFWGKGEIGLPTILFDSRSHESHWFQTPEMALKFMK